MDPKLAEMYGTNTLDDADLEKLAAAELADQLAEDGSMDLDGIDPDALEALAQEVLSDDGDGSDGSDGDDDQVKLAEADYLGRVMAHAYVQELRGIEKEAADHNAMVHQPGRGKSRLFDEKQAPGPKGRLGRAKESLRDMAGRAGAAIKSNPKKSIAAGAALAGGGALLAHKMTKKSSALETLIEARALELLEENGFEKDAANRVTRALGKAGDTVERHARKVTDPVGRAGQKLYGAAKTVSDDVKGSRTAANVMGGARRAGQFAVEHRGKLGVGAALAAGGAAAAHKMTKKSSALETLIEARALEILEENGIDPNEQEKTSNADFDVLADVVEQQAWDLLAANGFVDEE